MILKGIQVALGQESLVLPSNQTPRIMTIEQIFTVLPWLLGYCLVSIQQAMKKDSCF